MVQGLDRQNQENEGPVLRTTSSGGLNSMASALSIPLTDTPSMNNVEVNQRGNLAKRRGSQQLLSLSGSSSNRGLSGSVLETIKLRSLPSIIVIKNGTSLVYFTFNDSLTDNNREILEFSNSIVFQGVWSDDALYVKPDTVQTTEQEPRIIFTTGVNPPVQTTFVQSISTDSTTNSNNNTEVTFTNSKLENASTSNIFVFRDNQDVSSQILSTSYDSTNEELTVELSDTVTASGEFSVVFMSWQWWAEASATDGRKLYQRRTRKNSENVDKLVELPPELLLGIRPLEDAPQENPRYPLIPAPSDDYSDRNAFTYTLTPDQPDQYVFTSGGFFSSADPKVQVGLGFTGFGDVRRNSGTPTGEAEPVHYFRGLPIPFTGGLGKAGINLTVQVGSTTKSQNTDPNNSQSDSYYLKQDNVANYHNGIVTNNNIRGQFVDFTSEPEMGVGFSAFVQAVSTQVGAIGNNAQTTIDRFGIGTIFPGYGLWEFCDYEEGSFPRTVGIIGGRLVFGGMPKQPLTVAVSEVLDTLIPGTNFADFQTLLSDGNAANAFSFEVQADLNDRITAVEEFNNQLFIFTENALFRLTGGDSGLTPNSFFVQFQVGLGAVNARSIVKVQNTLYFMNKAGVFDIAGVDSASEYASAEISLKVRNFFDRNLFDSETAWMMYDERTAKLYVAMSAPREEREINERQSFTAERLLVYSTFRDAWTQYENFTGRLFSIDGTIIRRGDNDTVPLIFETYWKQDGSGRVTDANGSPLEGLINIYNEFRPVDSLAFNILNSDQTAPWSLTVGKVPARRVQYTMSKDRYFYPVTRLRNTDQFFDLFPLLPHREIEDVKVEIDRNQNGNWETLEFQKDFVKQRNSAYEEGIYLLSVVPDNSKDIRITKLGQPEDQGWNDPVHPIRVWIDNVLLVENQDYTISFSGNQYQIDFNIDASANAVIEIGLLYDAHWYSPKFFRGSMDRDKRFTHWYGYFHNEPYNELYNLNDVNTNSGQDPAALIENYKTPVGFNLVFNYNDTGLGYTSDADIYGDLDLFWDNASFDLPQPATQFNQYARIATPIIGASYNFQVGLLATKATYFELVGYQVNLVPAGRTSNAPNNAGNQLL